MIATRGAPLLRMEDITKSFPGVRALKGVTLELRAGEALAVAGENGAGKSTLIKILSGVHQPDGGAIFIDGRPVRFATPADAQKAGISVIYQEFNLVPSLTAAENIFLGHERSRFGFVSAAEERATAVRLFEQMNVRIDPDALCRELSVAQQQIVEIAKALSHEARLIVMDEPSATLTSREVENLFEIVRGLKARGISVIYISHRLEEIFAVTDRVTVMRDGEVVGTRNSADVGRRELIEMMVGRSLDREFPKQPAPLGEVRLEVRSLSRAGAVSDVSFTVRSGEVLGITGLVGAGRTELARLIFGADRVDAGEVFLDGKRLRLRTPLDAIRQGICLLTEDRKAQGLVLKLTARENFSLPNLLHWSRYGFVRERRERSVFDGFIQSLNIKVSHADQRVDTLSGGNQQKVLLARWLESDSEVIIFDEPTRGIDVGAKYEIYLLMNRLAGAGKAVIMISSEMPEVLGMSDRILVMHGGRITGEITDVTTATQEQILELAVGRQVAAAA